MMSDDIRFYSFDLDLLYILPAVSPESGYPSVNVSQELNGSGSLEISFCDEDLKKLIRERKDNLIVVWRDFQGFVTGYKYTEKENILTGMSLSGLLHRAVIPKTEEVTGDAETLARSAVSANIPWLTLGTIQGFTKEIKYSTDKYISADTYIQELLKLDNGGYKITADIPNKKYVFECIKSNPSELIISESELNAHSFETVYTNKNLAFGGWYLKEQPEDKDGNKVDPVWTYKTLDSAKTGVYKIDTVLSAVNDTEAENELKALTAEYTVSAETKDITHNTDYRLGDIVCIQNDGITQKKIIKGINMWNENGYGEEPVFSELEEDTNE